MLRRISQLMVEGSGGGDRALGAAGGEQVTDQDPFVLRQIPR